MNTTINETSRLRKAKRVLFGSDSHVYNFCIMTANNPIYAHDEEDRGTLSPEQNETLNNELVDFLQTRGFRFFKVFGRFDKSDEKSFIIYNIPLDYCMYLGKKFDQRSFIYAENEPDKRQVVFSYYEKDAGERDRVSDKFKQYKLKDQETRTNEIELDVDDNFSAIGRRFKFSVPFSIFNEGCNELNRLVNSRRDNNSDYAALCESMIRKSIKAGSPREQRFARMFLYNDRYYEML